MNEILNEFEDIKQENVLLKKNLKEIRQKLNNSDKNFCDVTITKNNVNSIDKPLYNSFFKESKYSSDSKTKLIQKNKTKIMIKSEGITSNSENEYIDRMPTNNKSKLKINLLETDEKELNLVETHNKLKQRVDTLHATQIKIQADIKIQNERTKKILDEIIDYIDINVNKTSQNTQQIINLTKNLEKNTSKFNKQMKINQLERLATMSYQEDFLTKLMEANGKKINKTESYEIKLNRLRRESNISDSEND